MYNIKVDEKGMRTINAALELYKLDLKNDPLRPYVLELAINIGEQQEEQREAVEAFERAIVFGLLSNDETADNWAGNYMYMAKLDGKLHFKHRMTRIPISMKV